MALINQIKIESEYLPTFVIDKPLEPGQPNFLLGILKPKITMDVGGASLVSAPWGEPKHNWINVKMVLIFLVGFFLVYKFFK